MRPGRIAAVIGVTVLVATGLYFFVYLWRWEWNRALIAGTLFVATEVAMATATVLGRLRRLDDRLAEPDPAVLARLRQSAPPPHDHFEWLSPRSGEMSVFVPVLIGMGVVASALAWFVERLARASAGPVLERGLARRLGPLGWPSGGLLPPDEDPTALLAGPAPHRRRP